MVNYLCILWRRYPSSMQRITDAGTAFSENTETFILYSVQKTVIRVNYINVCLEFSPSRSDRPEPDQPELGSVGTGSARTPISNTLFCKFNGLLIFGKCDQML